MAVWPISQPDGAYIIGGGDQNFGQGWTEGAARALFEVPLASLDNALGLLEQMLRRIPLDQLSAWLPMVPGATPADFDTVDNAVNKILSAMSGGQLWMKFADWQGFLNLIKGSGGGTTADVLAKFETAKDEAIQAIRDLLTGMTGATDGDVLSWITGLGGGGGGGTQALKDLLTGVTGATDNDVLTWMGRLGDGTGIINPGRLPLIPIGHIGDSLANLLPNGSLDGSVSVHGGPDWTFDPSLFQSAAGRTTPGSAKTTANGTQRELLSEDLIFVSKDQVIDVSGFLQHSGLAASGAAIEVGLQTYSDWLGASPLPARPVLFAPASPTGDSSGWLPVTGTYTVPAGVQSVRVRLTVLATATAGAVNFDLIQPSKTGLLPKELVSGLVASLQGLQDFSQSIIDNAYLAIFGPDPQGLPIVGKTVDDLRDSLHNIPATSVGGVSGMPTMQHTIKTMWDNVTSALRLTGATNVGLDDFAAAAQTTSQSAVNANNLSIDNYNVLGIRTNRGVMGGMERTTISNLNLDCLGSAATPSNFAVSQAASAMAFLRMPERDTKGVIYWIGNGNANITGFYLTLGKMALDGTITHLFTSANLFAQLTASWGWQSYTFPGANQITHASGDVLVVEFVVVGTGTHSIAGVSQAWMTNHPAATTKKGAATRNTAGGTPALNIAAGSVGFSGNVPYVGLGRSSVPTSYIPPEITTYPTSGAFTYTRPSWMVAGDIIDVFALAPGGGGQAGGYGLTGQGGMPGTWQVRSLVVGVDIPLSTATLAVNVGASAQGGINPYALEKGNSGGNTTVTGTGVTPIIATGGLGGGQNGNTMGTGGGGAGNQTITDYTAFGGVAVGQNQSGNAPGGGGGSGYPASGFPSGQGKVWFRARQGS